MTEEADPLDVLDINYGTDRFKPLPWVRWPKYDHWIDPHPVKKPDGRKGRKIKRGYITVTIRVRRRIKK